MATHGQSSSEVTGPQVGDRAPRGGDRPRPVGPRIDDPPLPGLDESSPLPAALARARQRRGGTGSRYTNRLILETSPYLLQHAGNPVNWYPWGDEPFERARAEGKLVFLSVGYSTCHWCHVMERESFEDPEIAAFMNRHFVAIKVDREERPDVDAVYMTAVQLLTGRGGWPMTVILSPDRQPLLAGTYFPPRAGRHGAGLLGILEQVQRHYREDPSELLKHAGAVSHAVRDALRVGGGGDVIGPEAIGELVEVLAGSFDRDWGGFGTAPKFPRPVLFDLLSRHVRRHPDSVAVEMLVTTLERMADGGMRDHVGGGFHRYATDRRWRIPHFEKMLYDNAQLAVAYLEAYQLTGREKFAEVARDTADYLLAELAGGEGGFYSATDADSADDSGVLREGHYFTWTPDELEQALGPNQARLVLSRFGLAGQEALDGRDVLFVRRSFAEVAAALELSPDAVAEQLAAARDTLREVRAQRPPPLLDDKVVTAWNGLAISALARLGFAFDESRYTEAAEAAARMVMSHMTGRDGRLLRTYRDGVARHRGCLDDYAFFIAGLLDLYEATFDPGWIAAARRYQRVLDREFAAPGGGYYFTGEGHEQLLVRDRPYYDGAEPSGNSIAALNLLRLEQLTGEIGYRTAAEQLLAGFAEPLATHRDAMPKMLAALDAYWDDPPQIVIAYQNGDDLEPLLRELRRVYLPDRSLAVVAGDGRPDERLWFAVGLDAIAGLPTAHVCHRYACGLPTTDPARLAAELREVEPLGDDD